MLNPKILHLIWIDWLFFTGENYTGAEQHACEEGDSLSLSLSVGLIWQFQSLIACDIDQGEGERNRTTDTVGAAVEPLQ